MKSFASNEALLVWLLFFSIGCFQKPPLILCSRKYPQHYYNQFFKSSYFDGTRKEYLKKKELQWREKSVMTCNCSWGSVPGDHLSARIVKGKVVGSSENYPMMVGIQQYNKQCTFCGGSILTEYHVLTAAHCVFDEDPGFLRLVVGTKRRCRVYEGDGQYIPILPTMYIHDYYKEDENHNDIAIVIASRQILFTPTVGPVCIHTEPVKSLEEPILILGWGKTGEELDQSDVLLKVSVNRIETSLCQKILPFGFINENLNLQMCTYGGNRDACGGDSGGPLLMVDHVAKRLVQVALVSMGKGCGRIGRPAVNTALYPYLGWIRWTIERTTRIHYPKSFKKCSSPFCYIDHFK